MRSVKRLVVLGVALGLCVVATSAAGAAPARSTAAASTSVAVTGYVVGGVKVIESDDPFVAFYFQEKNTGSTTIEDAQIVLTKVVGASDLRYDCITVSGGIESGDGLSCEAGVIKPGQYIRDVVVAQDAGSASAVSVTACAIKSLGQYGPCKTLSVKSSG